MANTHRKWPANLGPEKSYDPEFVEAVKRGQCNLKGSPNSRKMEKRIDNKARRTGGKSFNKWYR